VRDGSGVAAAARDGLGRGENEREGLSYEL
jgi:hypothetical protein